ncbi:MAG: GntR family transcriptional regulator [Victivallaceae bacterium]
MYEGKIGKPPGLVLRGIKSEIAAKDFSPGDFLGNETDIATKYKVSRCSVRKALGFLEQQGMIKKIARHGIFLSEKSVLLKQRKRDELMFIRLAAILLI